ncbi:MAG: hypothetical protein J6I49_02500 [Bacteroidales bacterium]|nr:hypothetical protein [Bacteroidales bacterium]
MACRHLPSGSPSRRDSCGAVGCRRGNAELVDGKRPAVHLLAGKGLRQHGAQPVAATVGLGGQPAPRRGAPEVDHHSVGSTAPEAAPADRQHIPLVHRALRKRHSRQRTARELQPRVVHAYTSLGFGDEPVLVDFQKAVPLRNSL